MALIDTHAHLCDPQFSADRSQALERAYGAGIETIVEIADAPSGWNAARDMAAGSQSSPKPGVFWACGFHPHYAEEAARFDFDIMKKAAMHPLCVALGEIGLDYVKSQAAADVQISLFRRALEVSAEAHKPVVIHCRNAQADTLRILNSFFGGLSRPDFCTGVIHCFQGDLAFAEGCMELGFYLGVDGPLTYPGAKDLRDVIAKVPLDRIVLETDSPYLPPQGFRGQRNESSYLIKVAEKLAEIFGKTTEEIGKVTTENARRLFRLHPKI